MDAQTPLSLSLDEGAAASSGAAIVLKRPRRSSLAEIAHGAIVEAIMDRQFKPGDHLTIETLASQLQVSSTPIREALTRAATERLVLQNNNRGFTVAPLLSEQEYHQLFEVRFLLETHALRVARLDESTTAHIKNLVARMPAMEHGPAYHTFKAFNQADHELHATLVRMSQNLFLIRAWEDLHFHLHVGRLYAGTGVIDFSNALREHRDILNTLEQGDIGALIRSTSYHIEHAEQRLRHLLSAATTPRG